MSIYTEELKRLQDGCIDSKLLGIGTIKVLVQCFDGSQEVLKRCKEVLKIVFENGNSADCPSLKEWKTILPQWFVSKCAKETSEKENEEWLDWWRTLSPEEQIKAEEELGWSLKAWIGWFEPGEREWFWWDAHIKDDTQILIELEITGWPFAVGALKWLLESSGAKNVLILD